MRRPRTQRWGFERVGGPSSGTAANPGETPAGGSGVSTISAGDRGLAAAVRHARANPPRAKRRFLAGLGKGEALCVKIGFPGKGDDTPTELMWLKVTAWKGQRITGILQNEPLIRTDLRVDQEIECREGDVDDWILGVPGSATEGDYSAEALREGGS